MKGNKDKCHLLVTDRRNKTINLSDAEIKSSDCEKLTRCKD